MNALLKKEREILIRIEKCGAPHTPKSKASFVPFAGEHHPFPPSDQVVGAIVPGQYPISSSLLLSFISPPFRFKIILQLNAFQVHSIASFPDICFLYFYFFKTYLTFNGHFSSLIPTLSSCTDTYKILFHDFVLSSSSLLIFALNVLACAQGGFRLVSGHIFICEFL